MQILLSQRNAAEEGGWCIVYGSRGVKRKAAAPVRKSVLRGLHQAAGVCSALVSNGLICADSWFPAGGDVWEGWC